VEDSLILDSAYLIDLEREIARHSPGPAHRFLERHENQRFFTTFAVSGEIAAGYAPEERPAWEELLAPFNVLEWTPDVSWHYAQTYRYLRGVGLLIGTNDLWIAATALAYEAPLVTSDRQHYARVPGLSIHSYRDS
jgi:predicted nucleic acid-binding protein